MWKFFQILFAPFQFLTAPFQWLLGWPVRLLAAPGRLLGMALPMRIAVLLAITLSLFVVTAYVAFFFIKDGAHWAEWTRPGRIALIGALLVTIPVIAWKTIKLFLEGQISPFVDIDEAWEAGVEGLRKNGLELIEFPLFLFVGGSDEQQLDSIMDAAGFTMRLRAVPDGRQPLRWYATDRAIFLACPRMGCLGLTNVAPSDSGGGSVERTLVATGGVSSTLMAESVPPTTTLPADRNDPGDLNSSGSPWGTLVAGGKTLVPGESRDAQQVSGNRNAAAPSRDAKNEQTERLRHVCQLLRRARQPYCSLNGILTIIPLPTLQDILLANKEAPAALQRDLATIRTTTGISSPVTVLVTGMETEIGFMELVRRVGPERSKARFGKGFDVTYAASPENLEALAVQAAGAFEDWVYNLFREREALGKAGNMQLYGLLCKIRSRLMYRLKNFLTGGLGLATEQGRQIIGGVYFAATGRSSDTQCFVRGAIEKVLQLEEEVEWTEEMVHRDRRYQGLTQLGLFLNTLLALGILGLIVFRNFYWHPA